MSDRSDAPPGRSPWAFSLSMLLIVVTGIAIGVAVWNERRKQEVAALIQVAGQQASTLGDGQTPRDRAETASFRATQLQLLRSEPVLRRVVRDPAIANLNLVQREADPQAWLARELRTKYYDNSELLRVSLRSDNPGEAVKIVNAVVDVYFKEYVERGLEANVRRREDLQEKYNQLRIRIVEMRTKIKNADANSPDFEVLRKELESLEAISGELHRQLQRLTLEADLAPRVQRLMKAEPPQ